MQMVSRLEKLLAALAVLPFGLGLTLSGDAPVKGDVVFSFADPEIIESSGLIAHDGLFATVNDSGDSGRVFTIDPADGTTVAETSWDGEPVDVESMALTPDGDVLVGDTGDNTAERDSIELIRVPFGEDGAVDPTTYELVYPDGSHDCESLLVHPKNGQVLVVAKEFIGRLYAGPGPARQGRPERTDAARRRGAADRHRRCLLPGREALHPARLREGGRLRLALSRPGRRRVLPARPGAGRGDRGRQGRLGLPQLRRHRQRGAPDRAAEIGAGRDGRERTATATAVRPSRCPTAPSTTTRATTGRT